MIEFIFMGKRWNAYCLLVGPAKLIDGIVGIVTFGFVFSSFSSKATFAAAKAAQRSK